MIEVEVEIVDVYDNPYDCYRVREINRLFKYGELREGEERIIQKSEVTEEQLREYSEIWLRLNKDLKVLNN